jgi:hypothetical protein
MDVKKIMEGISAISGINSGRKKELSQLDFQKLLNDATSNVKAADQSSSLSPSPGMREIPVDPAFSLPSLNFLPEQEEITQTHSQGIRAAEKTLNLLEEYQKAVGDPRITLKKVDPLVLSLSQEVNDLHLLSEKLSPSDPLQKIMMEIGIVSTVEIEKFNRGEYI